MKQKILWVGMIVISGGFLWGVVYFSNLYLEQKSGRGEHESKTVSCRGIKGDGYIVTIANDRATPLTTDARLCDTLTIINKDAGTRLIAFGVHDKHVTYAGVEEKLLKYNQSFTVTLRQSGKFIFHDHDNDTVRGNFTVRE
jgi:hypothetical protein